MRKLILKHQLSPGDVVMLTAAVRDLHRCYPGEFLTDVRTSCQELWENNPYITPLDEDDPDVEIVECHYPLIHESNQTPHHFLHGFVHFLNEALTLNVRPTAFRGDIYLSKEEELASSPVEEMAGENGPYWIIVAGGKQDYSIKWWSLQRYQEVVNRLEGRVRFVQVGGIGHFHPQLDGVVDLRGKLNMRQLLRLVYHSEGVVCPVTLLMHLAAAVKSRKDQGLRPCVVIAGGREPPHWEAYPGHQFIHTVGMLSCCSKGGCWKSRTVPLRDRSKHDQPENLCLNVVGSLPRCMDMISASEVIQRIEMFLDGKRASATHDMPGIDSLQLSGDEGLGKDDDELTGASARRQMERYMERIEPYPGTHSGRGIVVCGGGIRYFTNAWICINMLRNFGCRLPIQLWYLGRDEMDEQMASWVRPFDVECVDGLEVRKRHPARILNGWELKPYSILHCPFKELLYLDADNVPVVNPEFLFETWQYRETGAVFWPDFGRLHSSRAIWSLCGVAYRDEPEFETGQIVINKEQCWRPLCLTMWLNEHSDFFYHHVHGDKETFHMAFRKLDYPYAMPNVPIHQLKGTMCQHDFTGRRIFQHRNLAKWDLFERSARIEGFLFESECRRALEDLRKKWATNRRSVRKMIFEPNDQEPSRDPLLNKATSTKGKKSKICKNHFVIRARFDGYTGYGLHAQQLAKDFERFGHDFGILPIPAEQRTEAPVSRRISRRFASEAVNCKWELLLYPPVVAPNPGVSTVYFTMWETTQLPSVSLKHLERSEAIIVPCEWNATCFNAQGLSRPIFVSPLGIDPKLFRHRTMPNDEICIFGAAGNLSISGRTRKGIDTVIAAFKVAFPNEKNVLLRIKAMPEDEFPDFLDTRISVTTLCFNQRQLAEWYAGLTCFVSASKSEGWGLMQLQAMATGRPVIGCYFGGIREFFSDKIGYCVDYELQAADGRYSGLGIWAVPNIKSMAEQMRRVFENRKEAVALGIAANEKAREFTWMRANRRLEEILKRLGVLDGTCQQGFRHRQIGCQRAAPLGCVIKPT